MTFNINEFKSNVISKGLAKTSKFFVDITRPSDVQSNIKFLCDSASLPGIAFQTADVRQNGYGNIDSIPYVTTFETLQLTFLVDNDGDIYRYFHDWMFNIVNFNEIGTGENSTTPHSLYSFPDTYRTTITVTHLNDAMREIVKYKLHKAYPTNVGAISVAWAEGAVARLPVSFAYNSWESEYLSKGGADPNFDKQRDELTRTNQPGTVTAPLNTQITGGINQ